jgi:hypothetical protein
MGERVSGCSCLICKFDAAVARRSVCLYQSSYISPFQDVEIGHRNTFSASDSKKRATVSLHEAGSFSFQPSKEHGRLGAP